MGAAMDTLTKLSDSCCIHGRALNGKVQRRLCGSRCGETRRKPSPWLLAGDAWRLAGDLAGPTSCGAGNKFRNDMSNFSIFPIPIIDCDGLEKLRAALSLLLPRPPGYFIQVCLTGYAYRAYVLSYYGVPRAAKVSSPQHDVASF